MPVTREILVQIMAVITIIPLAPFICRFIPPVMIAGWNVDLIIAILIAIVIVRAIMWLVRPLIIAAFLIILGVLIYNQATNNYSFANIINDYKTIAYQNWLIREKKQPDVLSINPHLFENTLDKTTRLIRTKVNYQDSVVRNFSIQHSLESFDDYQGKFNMLTRYLSLFKYINTHFRYVPDAQRDEYFASARETILNGLGGDCDDHSILMASCLMSIGARCRLVIVQGHMYPELYAGNEQQYELLSQAIIQLFQKERIGRIYYHEHNNEYWINLDYTASYPGGPYMNDRVKQVIEL
ncbi:transglutaminase domain-containing protein [Deminuibacter soli]|uniref:Transglutaminase domain-containing protein n=2 Tax=Deminuibacter soli TaxID=2291815 RepID=A0A3E1NK45_9BACT|nr:transglutaminase domain-containing protein [Deminuibacter soli]